MYLCVWMLFSCLWLRVCLSDGVCSVERHVLLSPTYLCVHDQLPAIGDYTSLACCPSSPQMPSILEKTGVRTPWLEKVPEQRFPFVSWWSYRVSFRYTVILLRHALLLLVWVVADATLVWLARAGNCFGVILRARIVRDKDLIRSDPTCANRGSNDVCQRSLRIEPMASLSLIDNTALQ